MVHVYLQETTDADESTCIEIPAGMRVWPAGFVNMVHVRMPNSQSVQLPLRNDMTIGDILVNSCEVSMQHFHWLPLLGKVHPALWMNRPK